ncbi:cation:proton antiporter [Candidatus Pacearchaeota archaeon]|nr:cation:proton antiporter [Candidatus Pacearchaeota archaeon]
MVVESLFVELSLVIIVAVVVSAIVRALKQPMILGYIIAGIIVGPSFLNIIKSVDSISTFAHLGISILLFMVGLNLNPKDIKGVSRAAIITGLGQLLFLFVTGFGIAKLFGFDGMSSLYIALALSFSSTIIIMKFLTDRDQTKTIYGRIAIGFLIVQDLIHVIALISLIMLGSVTEGAAVGGIALTTLIKGAIVVVVLLMVSIYVLPSLVRLAARSQEMLFLFSLGWALLLATVFYYIDFSLEAGALVAGVTLSFSPYKYEINSRAKPLRDFLLLIFFVWLGAQLGPIDSGYVAPIVVFSLLVLIGTPLIVMLLMGFLGYTKRNSFLAGLTVAQISEFSFIITSLGVARGYISSDILTIVIAVGLVTIAGSYYSLENSEKIYSKLSKKLKVFERRGRKVDEGIYHLEKEYDVILLGYNRIGYNIKKSLEKMEKKILVVDNNPETIMSLVSRGYECRYGDAEDEELLGELPIKEARMIISTIPEFDTNILLIDKIKRINKKVIFIAVSHQIDETISLYKAGATYVITPHFFGGKHTSYLLENYGFDKNEFEKESIKDMKELLDRKKEGHRDVFHVRD